MKNLIVLLVATFLILAGCKTLKPERVTKLGDMTPYQSVPEYLNGEIKSVTEFNYWAIESNGEFIKGNIISENERDSIKWSSDFTATFDETGFMTKCDYSASEPDVGEWVMVSENGKLIKASFVRKDSVTNYFTFEYDANNFKESGKRWRPYVDTLLNTYSFKNDDRGNIVEMTYNNFKGERMGIYRYNYNDKNLTDNYNYYSSSDSLLGGSRIQYDEKGFYTKAEFLDGEGSVNNETTLVYTSYDDHGNWLTALITRNGKCDIIAERTYLYF